MRWIFLILSDPSVWKKNKGRHRTSPRIQISGPETKKRRKCWFFTFVTIVTSLCHPVHHHKQLFRLVNYSSDMRVIAHNEGLYFYTRYKQFSLMGSCSKTRASAFKFLAIMYYFSVLLLFPLLSASDPSSGARLSVCLEEMSVFSFYIFFSLLAPPICLDFPPATPEDSWVLQLREREREPTELKERRQPTRRRRAPLWWIRRGDLIASLFRVIDAL